MKSNAGALLPEPCNSSDPRVTQSLRPATAPIFAGSSLFEKFLIRYATSESYSLELSPAPLSIMPFDNFLAIPLRQIGRPDRANAL